MPGAPVIPPAHTFVWDTVEMLRQLGGSAQKDEIDESIDLHRGLTEEQQAVSHGDRQMTEIAYRLIWARTHAKLAGLLVNSSRGVWALTPDGWTASREEVKERKRLVRPGKTTPAQAAAVIAEHVNRSPTSSPPSVSPVSERLDTELEAELPAEGELEYTWRQQLLTVLLTMDPPAFERLCQRLLREAGFSNITVTGKSGDGGIDGLGVYRLSLISFPVFFQCKRYASAVSSSHVRDFRGAMVGRGDKGLLITTSTFTSEAKREATREGAPPIDLIDGEHLADLLTQYSLGVTTTERVVQDVAVSESFFAAL